MKSSYAVAAMASALLVMGCEQDVTQPNYEFAPDMVSSQAYDSFAGNPNTPDGKTLLEPAVGSIPRGVTPLHFGPGFTEAQRAGRELTNPVNLTPQSLARGEVAFNRYCSPCHATTGAGQGPVTIRFPNPPSLLAEHARGLPDGQLFHIITFGQGVMPAHGSQVAVDDRWRITQWVRRLQRHAKPAQEASR